MKHSRLTSLLADRLARLEHQGLRRTRAPGPVEGDTLFSSNDYLGLARTTAAGPSGARASRLVAGDHVAHRELEAALATWLGVEATLLFSSGYAANVGVVAALASPGDLVVSDVLNHASLIDGARLSRARIEVTPHLDLAAVDAALAARTETTAFVLAESYYSMDADTPDLAGLREVCDRRNAFLILDEAHALGVLGPTGRGLSAAAGVAPDVLVGTFGKALGAQGAFAAGSAALADWLWNRARSFVFSTGLAPVLALAAHEALNRVSRDPSLAARATANARHLRGLLAGAGLPASGHGHIAPVVVGDATRATALARALADAGFHVPAIRPPTVPAGTARLRFTATASQEEPDFVRLDRALARAVQR